MSIEALLPDLFRISDTCHVYVLRSDRSAIAVDFGSGEVLHRLADIGVDRLTDVLVTHHHRDQVQGLRAALDAGIRVWVPPVEQDRFRFADEFWQARQLDNYYNVRDDRDGPLWSLGVTGILPEYRPALFGDRVVSTLPTPGHTVGSVTLLTALNGKRVAFTGDLIMAPGKVWSLASTQWSYNGIQGVGATWLSAKELAEQRPELLLPSHGDPITEPGPALSLLAHRLMALVDDRGSEYLDLQDQWERPFESLTPHLLANRTSVSRSYVLLSDSGKALVIDYGYDSTPGTTDRGDRGIRLSGMPDVGDRTSRRPLLSSIRRLKQDFGVDRVDVAIPTHYHDDHVAGFGLLHAVEGTQIWVAETFADILQDPSRHDLPCLWYDPLPVDRSLPMARPFRWEEYEMEVHDLPGHTLYACAISFEADGLRVVASGDQQGTFPNAPEFLNYTYRNRFRHGDFIRSAQLYRELDAKLLISGHWRPRRVDGAYLDDLLDRGLRLARRHEELLPFDQIDLGAEGRAAWIRPYRPTIPTGGQVDLDIELLNPFPRAVGAMVRGIVPDDWRMDPPELAVRLGANASATVRVRLNVSARPARRERIAVDLTIDGRRFGAVAEALVTVDHPGAEVFRRLGEAPIWRPG